jgi:hypothetical protein
VRLRSREHAFCFCNKHGFNGAQRRERNPRGWDTPTEQNAGKEARQGPPMGVRTNLKVNLSWPLLNTSIVPYFVQVAMLAEYSSELVLGRWAARWVGGRCGCRRVVASCLVRVWRVCECTSTASLRIIASHHWVYVVLSHRTSFLR